MSESSRRRKAFFAQHPLCVFCGGAELATTVEHCPPRSLFRDKAWPAGFEFPACDKCNSGSSDDDLMVQFLASMGAPSDSSTNHESRSLGLMKAVRRQHPGVVERMLNLSPIEARSQARRLKMTPEPGQRYQDLGIVRLPPEVSQSVEVVAAKLVKALYYMETQSAFPPAGVILIRWFTNAEIREHGMVFVLEAFKDIKGSRRPLERNGKDLSDQFDYVYSKDPDGGVHLLRVIFGTMFGFVGVFSQTPEALQAMDRAGFVQLSPA